MRHFIRIMTALALLLPGAIQASELALYTSMPKDNAEQLVNAFEAKNPGIKVQLFRAGSGQMREAMSVSRRTVSPPGFSRSEAIFDNSLFGVTPIEHDSPVASRTAR